MPDLDPKRPRRAPSTPPAPERVGLVLAERYRLERLLGEGAMGAVYLAEHVHMRKRYALKLLHGHATRSPELVARFEREAIAAGHLSHPNIAAASDFGQLPDGAFFLVLEYVDGRSLRDELDAEGALHPRRALGIARQLVSALGAAHAKGIVHRDVKPENVMLVVRSRSGPTSTSTPFPGAPSVEEPLVKVLDFGIAKLDANASLGADTTASGTPLTRAGAIYGTPQYMAPEQAAGGDIDHRADFYAVGAVLYEMITGRPPFEGEAMEIIAQMLTDAPVPLWSDVAPALVSPELRALVDELLAKERGARPANAAEVVARLDAISAEMSAEMSALRPLPPPPPPPPPPPTGPFASIGAATPASPLARLAPLARTLQLSLVQTAIVLAFAVLMPLVLVATVALSGSRSAESDASDSHAKPKRRASSEAAPSASARASSDKGAAARPTASTKGSASAAASRPSASPLERLIGFP